MHATLDTLLDQLAAAVTKLEGELEANRPVGVVARAVRPESLAVITAACGRQRVPLAFLSPDSQALAGELHDWAAIDDGLALPATSGRRGDLDSVPPPVIVATSGTSGPPKLVDHAWD